MGKPSPSLLALAVAGVISVSGCAAGLARSGEEPAGQVTRQSLGPKLPNAADPDYEKTYAQYRDKMNDREVVAPALGYKSGSDSGTIRQVGLGSGVSSMAESISSGVQNGLAKVGKIITPEQQVLKAPEPTSVFNRSKPSPDLYVAMARLQEQSGKLVEAEQQYRMALRMAPDHLGGLLGYAHLKDRVGRLDEAVQLYQRAAAAYPNEPAVFNDMGLCYARNGRLDEAVTALNRAVQLEPKRPLYRNNIAIVLTEMGQTDSAFMHFRVVQQEAVARYNLGQLLLRKGQQEAAAEQFALALKSDPSLAQAKAWLGELARRGIEPPQTPARIASKPPEATQTPTIPRTRPAQPDPAANGSRPSAPNQPAPETRPTNPNRPAPEPRTTRDLRSVYGNFPVPPGRRLRGRPGTSQQPSTPPAMTPDPPAQPPWQTAPQEPAREPVPPALRPSAPQPSAGTRPAAEPPPSSLPRSIAPEPRAPGGDRPLPELFGGEPDNTAPPLPPQAPLLAPLPPVTDSGHEIRPLPPVETAPLPGE